MFPVNSNLTSVTFTFHFLQISGNSWNLREDPGNRTMCSLRGCVTPHSCLQSSLLVLFPWARHTVVQVCTGVAFIQVLAGYASTVCKHMNLASPLCLGSLTCIWFFIYGCFPVVLWFFPGVSASMSVGTQNYCASPLSQVTHLHF